MLSQQCTASFKDLHTIGGSCRRWRLLSSLVHCGVKQIWIQAVAVMVSYHVTFVVTVYGEFFGEPNSSPLEMSGGFISLHAKPHKTHVY